jgi:acetyl-CoA carboxylase biotin carboxyl carrier protein
MGKERGFEAPDQEEILEILKLVDESDIEELRLEVGGVKLIVGKGVVHITDQELEPTHPEPQKSIPMPESTPAEPSPQGRAETEAPAEGGVQKAEPEVTGDTEEEGLLPVKSPLLGTFYRAPKPGAPPFVDVGSYVTEDDTVCLIEIMKLFNTVKAGVKGRVSKVCAENNQMVEYGQVLFLVEAEGESGESFNT